jgi:lactoylglutathione lyase
MLWVFRLTILNKVANPTFTPNAERTFSHIGLIVDDMAAAKTRFEALGIKLLKKRGALDLSAKTEDRTFLKAIGAFN